MASRVFISHSHADDDYCRLFTESLRKQLGSDDAVWYDETTPDTNLGYIQQQILQRPIFILLLSPAALRSSWVADECEWAYSLFLKAPDRTLLTVVAAPTDRDSPFHLFRSRWYWYHRDHFWFNSSRNVIAHPQMSELLPLAPDEAARRVVEAVVPAAERSKLTAAQSIAPAQAAPEAPPPESPLPADIAPVPETLAMLVSVFSKPAPEPTPSVDGEDDWHDFLGELLPAGEVERVARLPIWGAEYLAKQGELLAVRTSKGQMRFPAFQFKDMSKGEPYTAIGAVLRSFWSTFEDQDTANFMAASWLKSPQDELDGETPISWLEHHDDQETVIQVAESAAARLAH